MLAAGFTLKRLWVDKDKKSRQLWLDLLALGHLGQNEQVDYTLAIFHGNNPVATGSLDGNILKCLVVCKDYQAENLLTELVIALTERLAEQDISHCFLYTALDKEKIFHSLGFRLIAKNEDILFMERGKPDFSDYLKFLKSQEIVADGKKVGAIVMNANPFTKGHRYLVEQAKKACDIVYVFVLSEERSKFSAVDRMNMVKLGTKDLENVVVLPTLNYMVSQATFPSYFLKERSPEKKAWHQARLDATLFKEKIAPVLNISTRFVGEEPFSPVTNLYNETMEKVFSPELALKIIPRLAISGNIISATKVRKAIEEADSKVLEQFLPETSYTYLKEHNLL